MTAHFRSLSALLLVCICMVTHAFSIPANSRTPTAPTVDSMDPTSSHVGDTVTITGTGFDALNVLHNKVYFANKWYVSPSVFDYDSIQAEIIAVTSTRILAVVPLGASNGEVFVSVNEEFATSQNIISYNIIPTITSLIPSAGYVGDTITIAGTGFDAWHQWGNFVWFTNGNNTQSFSATPTSIKVVVPTHSTTGPVKVFTSATKAISPSDFVILPSITDFQQTSGAVGEEVIIFGFGFDPAQSSSYQLTFNGTPAVLELVLSTSIRTRVPVHASTGPVQLICNGVVAKGSGRIYLVNPTRPAVSSLTPASGVIGSSVKITGSAFDQGGPPLTVIFGGDVLAEIDSFTQTAIYTNVPPGAQSGSIIVTAGGISENGPSFRVIEVFGHMQPARAHVGDTIVVTGSGFFRLIPDYYFIDFPFLRVHPSVSDSTFSFVVPSTASSSFIPLVLSNYNLGIHVELPPLRIVPVIESIEPDTVIYGREAEIVVHGTGFNNSPPGQTFDLIFSDDAVRHLPQVQNSSIVTTVPQTVAFGTIPVSVRIDSLESLFMNLVVLPDTFPYTPPAPKDLYASNVTATSFHIHWSDCYRALGYILDVSADNFATMLPGFRELIVNDTSKLISGLAAGTHYKFRVRPYSDTDTTSITSDGIYREVITIPPPPRAILPANVDPFGVVCLWSSSKGADYYLIDVTDNDFTTFISGEIPDTAAVLLPVNGSILPPVIKYRVRAANSWGASTYSNVIIVRTTGITGIGDEPTTASVMLYPNPSSSQVFISGLSEGAVSAAHLIDAAGRTTPANLSYKGDHVFSYDIQSLPNGFYILQMVVEQKTIQLRFIKQ